ncbi:MAG: malectin domain-containing carbohydrate-binding protein [Candidatus Solibacter sp.]
MNGGIQVFGPYSWYWDFEIMNTFTGRVSSQSGSFPTDIPQTTGILPVNSGTYPTVLGVKFINLVAHDTANGLSSFSAAPGTEIYGCLTYNNGWIGTDRGHGHGIYLQNIADLKLIDENFVFNNFDAGLHPAGSGAATIKNISMIGNVVFNNGQAGGHRVDNIIVEGGGTPKTGIVLDSNYIYNPVAQVGNAGYNRVGWEPDGINGDLVMTNNVWVGGDPGLQASNWTKLTGSNNTFYAQTTDSTNYQGQLQMRLLSGQNLSQFAWDNNTYYASGWRQLALFNNGTQTYAGGLSGWQAATGLDGHSQAVASVPTGIWTYVRPNKYETGRANIIIYNWDLTPSVTVGISAAGLATGQSYEIRDVQNFFGNPVAQGTYTGQPVTIPMSGLTMAQPVGAPVQLVHTAPQFGAFVVLPVGATATSTTTVSLSPGTSTLTNGQTQQFYAIVTGASNTTVTWSLSPNLGSISAAGLYTAPATISTSQTVTLTATSQADATKSASASITLNPAAAVTPPSVSLSSPAGGSTVSGSVTVSAAVTAGSFAVAGVQFKLDGASLGSEVTAAPYQKTWDTTQASNGSHTLTATVRDSSGTLVTSGSVSVTVSNTTAVAGTGFAIRVNAGGGSYIDNLKQTWSADMGYTGGGAWSSVGTINGTLNPTLYQSERYGNFVYQFAVPNGSYTVNLKFAEQAYSQPGLRQFNVSINGLQVLTNFDIVAAAGAAMKAVDRSFSISVTGGQIAIQFSQGALNTPLVNAIEIVGTSSSVLPTVQVTAPAASATVSGSVTAAAAVTAGTAATAGVQFKLDGVNLGTEVTTVPYQETWNTTQTTNGLHSLTATVRDTAGNLVTSAAVAVTVQNTTAAPASGFAPIRVNAGGGTYIDNLNQTWSADTGYTGGSAWSSVGTINGTLNPALYQSERYGNFSYQFTVPNGSYTVNLKFAEQAYSQPGLRQFNVSINGLVSLTNFDIVAAAGAAMKAVDRSFSISVAGGQITIQLSQGAINSPLVNAIEIVAGSGSAPSVQVVAPTSGTTVSGLVTVSAAVTASSAAIAGVQFKLDGVNLGVEVLSAPYQSIWNTTQATNGSHALTATVRDTAGNLVNSLAVNITVANSSSTAFTPIRVNAGGSTYIDNLNQTWSADTGYIGGTAWGSIGKINNTLNPTLYVSERYGTFSYQFTVPNNTYTVNLKFAEQAYTKPGQRQFNVSIDGQQVLTNFDIVATAGAAMTAVDKAFTVTATGGQITITFSQGAVNSPLVNAIEIY